MLNLDKRFFYRVRNKKGQYYQAGGLIADKGGGKVYTRLAYVKMALDCWDIPLEDIIIEAFDPTPILTLPASDLYPSGTV